MLFLLFFFIFQSIRALETNTPASAATPISVSIEQMTSKHGQCNTAKQCSTDEKASHNCGETCSGGNGDYFEYDFYGQQFQIYGSTGTDFSDITIILNGNSLGTISTSGQAATHKLLYTSEVYNYDHHKIRVENGNSGKQFAIYKFTYWPSIKAKRVNFTGDELGGGGNWQQRSDGIGGVVGWINNADGIAQTTVPTSRIWIYGAKDPGNGNIQITIHKKGFEIADTKISQNAEQKIEGCLIYDSDILPFSNYLISILNPNRIQNNDKMYISLSCIFYEYDPPTQSPAPMPSPTVIAVTQDQFIDKEYHDYIPCGFPGIPSNSPISKITGCKFYNIYPGRAFITGPFGKQIEFSNNLFEYSDGVESSALAWVSLSKAQFTIDHCTFNNYRYQPQAGEGLILSFNQEVTIKLDSCLFKNIGHSEAHFMFKVNSAASVLNVQNCTFFNDEKTDGSKFSILKNSEITFNGCTFTKPARDMIRISSNDQATGKLRFTNNVVQKSTKTFIMATQVKNAITIQNNVFQDINLISSYLISFTLYNTALTVDLNNNTFQRITTHTECSFGGGIASWYQSVYQK